MSVKAKLLACAATLTLVGSLSTTTPPPAGAATPGCGPHRVQVFSAEFGTNAKPNFVESVYRRVARDGDPTVLQAPSGSDPAGDMIVSAAGPVSMFFAAGMVSADVSSHYMDAQ